VDVVLTPLPDLARRILLERRIDATMTIFGDTLVLEGVPVQGLSVAAGSLPRRRRLEPQQGAIGPTQLERSAANSEARDAIERRQVSLLEFHGFGRTGHAGCGDGADSKAPA
jgi:hypothetical protein